MKSVSTILVLLVLNLGFSSVSLAAARVSEFSERGMVSSRSTLASQVGVDILAQGGNAIDAVVAVGFALAVTYPSAGNLGGGGFMVIHLANGTITTNDHREKAPGLASRDMFLDAQGDVIEGSSTASYLAVGVPGSVAGLLDVLDKYGTLPRAKILQPAIDLAAKGFVLSPGMAGQFARRLGVFKKYPASMAVFSKDGDAYAPGELFKQPDLAATLKRIKRLGRGGFYAGKTADLLVADMRSNGGLISHEDLAQYQSIWRDPVRGTYKGYDIISMPPPSSGGVLVVQMLNMLEPLDLQQSGFGGAATIHAMVEAQRRAYADRAEHLGDPDFYPVPVDTLISKAYAKARFADFDAQNASLSSDILAGSVPNESPDTTHVSVMDIAGNAVAYTTTLNLSYGSKIVAAGTGVLLNNEMDDFSSKDNTPNAYGLIGREANAIAPGKRMLSSMTPTIVMQQGKPVLVTGSPGGSTIITTVLQVILNVIDHKMDLSDAVASPRFHHQWQPDRVVYERFAFSPDTLSKLESMGHRNLFQLPSAYGRGMGDANSVMRTKEGIVGMSDPRNDGGAIGVH